MREYSLPNVDFAATQLSHLLESGASPITEPPITANLTDAEIENIRSEPLAVGAYPVHTVAVERGVKVVTEAAGLVVGEEQRHGYICSRLKHRRELPAFENKASFTMMVTGKH